MDALFTIIGLVVIGVVITWVVSDEGIIYLIFVVIFIAIGLTLFGTGIKLESLGKPKISIDAGTYTIVGYVEVSKDKQPYYQMILEQEGGVKLYTLPKDMIDITQSNEKQSVLEVIEKAGIRKVILYLPANQISHH